ncbi:MAG: TIM barrel protein [Beijerinckiaceae bacterium]|nr:TIM barrel protein [Beijerinckiaceae bacterium]
MSGARLRFSANISMLFCERPFLERISAAAAAGFDAVECHFPYNLERAELRARLDDAGVVMNGINTAPGNAQEFGLAALAGREDDFTRAMEQALEWAQALGASTIHVMAGCPAPQDRAWALDTYLHNLERACAMAKGAPVTLLIEPINTYDRRGYFLSRSDEAADIIADLRAQNLRMMFDFYHVQIMEGDLLRRLERHWDVIGHIQFASVPHRHEPDEGEVAYPAIFKAIAQKGWPHWVAAEYRPRARTEDGLAWLANARA